MSDYRVTCGIMAELAFPVPEDDWESVNDKMYEMGLKMSLNYEGTLIFTEDVNIPLYDFEIQLGQTMSNEDFIEKCNSIQMPIIGEPKPFTTVWYDGADSVQSDITLKQFKEQ